MNILRREFIYIWYYFSVQLEQILGYWVLGMVLGSAISVFGKKKIHAAFSRLGESRLGVLGLIPASILGIASPLYMYGTIPLAASFSQKGMRDDLLAAFMMSSILLNPQLLIYSAALGTAALTVRILSCFLCGIGAGLCVRFFYKDKSYFNFSGFQEAEGRDTDPNLLLAATVGVPLYACGGGTIPLLSQWLASGMSLGAAASFMITGPATKITNLGALKIVLGVRRFFLYLMYVVLFSLASGLMTNLIL